MFGGLDVRQQACVRGVVELAGPRGGRGRRREGDRAAQPLRPGQPLGEGGEQPGHGRLAGPGGVAAGRPGRGRPAAAVRSGDEHAVTAQRGGHGAGAPPPGLVRGAHGFGEAGERGQLRGGRRDEVGAGGDAPAQWFAVGVEQDRDARGLRGPHQGGVAADREARGQAAAEGDGVRAREEPGEGRVEGVPFGAGDDRAGLLEAGDLAGGGVDDADRAAGGAGDRSERLLDPAGTGGTGGPGVVRAVRAAAAPVRVPVALSVALPVLLSVTLRSVTLRSVLLGEQPAQHLAGGAAREARHDGAVAERRQQPGHGDASAARAFDGLGDPVGGARGEAGDAVGDVQGGVERDGDDHLVPLLSSGSGALG
ncbi:hypothetical protein ADZ36_06445 [Streptomyces fradiae]|uniref:Uncharacterized protein n=1 Tax=Streptomyces fradiae TaxID=1906 RepID=A0ACC4WFC9_STRFR|nr:hypothetical protein ADZ36_06445 [Streptomyces fradiae]